MKHKISKFKIKSGKDANKMLMRKLVRNFVEHGELKTTITKARYLRSKMESLVHSALSYTQAVKNQLLPIFQNEESVIAFVEKAKKHVTNNTGSGSVKLRKLGERPGDAAPMAQVVWTNHIEEVPVESKKTKKVKSKKIEKVETSKEEVK